MNKLLKCYKTYDKNEMKTIDTYINKIYKQLIQGEKYLLKNWGSSDDNINISNLSEIIYGRFVPDQIKEYITDNIQSGIMFKRVINEKTLKINFFNFTNRKELYKILDFDNLISVFLIFYLLSLYSSDNCAKNVNIYIFFTPFKKELPKKKSETIGVNNVNSGYSTIGCNDTTTIVIYREEEWLKVLIHELFHNLGLDFSTKDIKKSAKLLQEHFGVKSDYSFFETYCETWARILNVCVKSFIKTDVDDSKIERKANYITNFHTFMPIERLFTFMQASTILTRFKDYDEYKEDSNVFCYYILTACLMNDYLAFFNWCNTNNIDFIEFNDTANNIEKFAKFIIFECEKKKLNSFLDCIKNLQKIKCNSLRMSIV